MTLILFELDAMFCKHVQELLIICTFFFFFSWSVFSATVMSRFFLAIIRAVSMISSSLCLAALDVLTLVSFFTLFFFTGGTIGEASFCALCCYFALMCEYTVCCVSMDRALNWLLIWGGVVGCCAATFVTPPFIFVHLNSCTCSDSIFVRLNVPWFDCT